MARKVKCRYCKKWLEKDKAYTFDYLNRNLEIKSRFYCDKHCCDQVELEKQKKEECFKIINELLEMPCRANIYFNKMYSPIINYYGVDSMLNFLQNEYEHINSSLQKDFLTDNIKIKYFFAIIQNNISKYKNVKSEKNDIIEELSNEIIDDDFIPRENKIIQKRSIEDILNRL